MRRDQAVLGQLLFSAKVFALRLRRGVSDLADAPRRWPQTPPSFAGTRTEIRSRLYSDPRAEERLFELGKVANLRVAIGCLNGIEIPAGEVFSFWRSMGRATRRRGFVNGRMLQLGCVVPAVGGGLCQLSNALYELALQTDCEVVERHAHSQRLPGAPLRDATVAWNYIDLRFRARVATRIELQLSDSELIAAFVCAGTERKVLAPAMPIVRRMPELPATCATCSELHCARHEQVRSLPAQATAYLVDGLTPEFDAYLQQTRTLADWLLLPIAGPRYAWTRDGFGQVKAQRVTTLLRAVRSRRLASQGAARQTYLLRSSAAMAAAMTADVPYWIGHLVIDQTLLAALWQAGALGGRTFDVLLRRPPISVLQARLDGVAARWPESPTANDFRAPESVLRAEQQALAAARRVITPHCDLVQLFAGRGLLLDWRSPEQARFRLQGDDARPKVFYPGPVAARKGAYVLRDAIAGLPFELVVGGAQLEGPGFWGNRSPRRAAEGENDFALVVQPSFIEEQPRALLHALRSGVPAIATQACGLTARRGLELVDAGNVEQLRAAIVNALHGLQGE